MGMKRSLSMKKKKTNVLDLTRVVRACLVFSQNNLYMVLKERLPTDLFKYVKIRFTDVDRREGVLNVDVVSLSSNIAQILVQMNKVLPVSIVDVKRLGHS